MSANETTILTIVEGLLEHLGHADVTAAYPKLVKLNLNKFANLDTINSPSLDLNPLGINLQQPAAGESMGAISEHAVATIGYQITTFAGIYYNGVNDAYDIWNDFRKALNMNGAAVRAGANWVRVTNASQAEPDFDESNAFVNLTGLILCGFEVENR